MKRATILLGCLIAGGAQFAQAQNAAPAISGRVFDDTTGCPVGAVRVEVVGSTSHALTNVQGRYWLTGLPSANFVLQAVHAGYQPQQTLSMTVSDSSARVDFSLVRAAGDSAKRVVYPKRTCQLEPPNDKP